jgi:hypothetical protein
MAKIETLGRWGAKAALADAASIVNEEDGVLIMIMRRDGTPNKFRSANLTNAEALFIMEDRKFNMFFELEGGPHG